MFGKDNKIASIADAVKQVVEASPVKIPTPTGTKVLGTRYGNSAKAHRDQTADPFAGHKGPGKKDLEDIEKPKKEGFTYFTKKLLANLEEDKEIQKQIDEVLSKDASAGDWIHDFIHSDNPKFKGKSKAERKKMALGAYYAKQNEEAEQTDEALIGNQKKLDKNHNNRLDSQDFKILRGQKKANEETVDEVVRVLDVSKSNAGVKPKTPEARSAAAAVVKAARANKPKDNYTGKTLTGAGSVGAGQRQAGKTATHIAVKEDSEEYTYDVLDEVTRKHFQQVADIIKSHQDENKRKELAKHHADIFATQNPRFDRAKFMKAANVNEETIDEVLNPANKTIDTLAGRSKKVPAEAKIDNGHTSAKTQLKAEAKQPEQDNVPFTPDKNVGETGTVTDKSGAKHTPMSRARHLARMALKRVQSDLKVK